MGQGVSQSLSRSGRPSICTYCTIPIYMTNTCLEMQIGREGVSQAHGGRQAGRETGRQAGRRAGRWVVSRTVYRQGSPELVKCVYCAL